MIDFMPHNLSSSKKEFFVTERFLDLFVYDYIDSMSPESPDPSKVKILFSKDLKTWLTWDSENSEFIEAGEYNLRGFEVGEEEEAANAKQFILDNGFTGETLASFNWNQFRKLWENDPNFNGCTLLSLAYAFEDSEFTFLRDFNTQANWRNAYHRYMPADVVLKIRDDRGNYTIRPPYPTEALTSENLEEILGDDYSTVNTLTESLEEESTQVAPEPIDYCGWLDNPDDDTWTIENSTESMDNVSISSTSITSAIRELSNRNSTDYFRGSDDTIISYNNVGRFYSSKSDNLYIQYSEKNYLPYLIPVFIDNILPKNIDYTITALDTQSTFKRSAYPENLVMDDYIRILNFTDYYFVINRTQIETVSDTSESSLTTSFKPADQNINIALTTAINQANIETFNTSTSIDYQVIGNTSTMNTILPDSIISKQGEGYPNYIAIADIA